MARYRLNTTKYALKWPKKHQKVPKFNKITLSTLNPSLRLSYERIRLMSEFSFRYEKSLDYCQPRRIFISGMKSKIKMEKTLGQYFITAVFEKNLPYTFI